jgi:hypothetical protein
MAIQLPTRLPPGRAKVLRKVPERVSAVLGSGAGRRRSDASNPRGDASTETRARARREAMDLNVVTVEVYSR